MSDLMAARSQMAMSLGFHILFSVVGMALPVLMVIAQWRHLRTGNAAAGELAQRWAKGSALLFAVGAVSGTVLSFELGLLWPRFMELAGPLIGMPFSLESFAFFIEAIFLGIYLYGRDRLSPWLHWGSGVVVAVSGLSSGVFVMAVNGFMNTPAGFVVKDGVFTDIDLVAAFFNPAFFAEALHMSLAAYTSVAFVVAGIHAWRLRTDPESPFHHEALRIACAFAVVVVPLQLGSGDIAAKLIAKTQPMKLAAAEGLYETGRGVAFSIGGIPNDDDEVTRYAVHIPKLLSFLATGDPVGEVKGLKEVPREDRPPTLVVHLAFQLMIACGLAMGATVGLGVLLLLLRRRPPWRTPWFRRLLVVTAPLGFIAVEAGWVVTEVGRQPWILQGVLRTKDAVTPVPNLMGTFTTFTLLYVFLGVVTVLALRRHVFSADAAHGALPKDTVVSTDGTFT